MNFQLLVPHGQARQDDRLVSLGITHTAAKHSGSPGVTRFTSLDNFRVYKSGLTLHGYQLYAFEHWLVDRSRRISTIVSPRRGDTNIVKVDVLVPRSSDLQERLIVWDRAVQEAKEDGWQVELVSPKNYSEHCHIFTKSLIDVQQNATPVLIPEGDLLNVQNTLFTNINLRRLNIGARGALSLNDASATLREKFLTTYKLPSSMNTHELFAPTVLALVNIIQVALALFDLGPIAHSMNVPDGLLCDATIAGLRKWEENIGKILFEGYPFSDHTILPTSTIAALLSTVIAFHGRLAESGAHNLPECPLHSRWAFLQAVAASTPPKAAPGEVRFLTADLVSVVARESKITTQANLRHIFKHSIDGLKGDSSKGFVKVETCDINVFVESLRHLGTSATTITALWRGQPQKTIHKLATSFKTTNIGPRNAHSLASPTQQDSIVSDSDDDKIGSKLFREAYKQTKRIGGGVSGFVDKTLQSSHDLNRMFRTERADLGNTAPDGLNSGSMSRLLPSPSLSKTSLSIPLNSPAEIYETRGGFDIAPSTLLRAPGMRRTVTDSYYVERGHSSSDDEEDLYEPANDYSMLLRKRHSFDCEDNLPALVEIMPLSQMKTELDLYLGYRELKQQEETIKHYVEQLRAIHGTYDRAVRSVAGPMQTRREHVEALLGKSKSLHREVDQFGAEAGAMEDSRAYRGEPSEFYGIVQKLARQTEQITYNSANLSDKLRDVDNFHQSVQADIAGSENLMADKEFDLSEQRGQFVEEMRTLISDARQREVLFLVWFVGVWRGLGPYLKSRYGQFREQGWRLLFKR